VHPKHGSLGDFVAFMRRADALGIRVIVDLVVNHTSIDSPWFQQARADAHGFFREWYVWSAVRPKNHKDGIVFPGQQTTTWTKDRRAGQYYFHRFYAHQADLNTWHPYVRAEIQKIMGFWLQLGVSGFRMDAVPFLIEKKGAGIEHQMDFNLLKEMRDFLQWRSGDAIMLAEANVPPDESLEYFGPDGDRLQMMLNFPVNQRLFYALATGDLDPLIRVAGRGTRSGYSFSGVTTSSIWAASRPSSARKYSTHSGQRNACSSTIEESGAAWHRCWPTIANGSSWPSACCFRCRAHR
jgi:maltose alpha-D-glucosyltransferase/alpha-amylase